MAIPSKWVRKDKKSGIISMVFGLPFERVLEGRYHGFMDDGKRWFAATAELAMDNGHEDMAKAWAVFHKCPIDCPLNLCSSVDCYKIEVLESTPESKPISEPEPILEPELEVQVFTETNCETEYDKNERDE